MVAANVIKKAANVIKKAANVVATRARAKAKDPNVEAQKNIDSLFQQPINKNRKLI